MDTRSRLVDARNTLDDLLKQLADKEALSLPTNEDIKEQNRCKKHREVCNSIRRTVLGLSYRSTGGSQPTTPRKRGASSGNRTPRKRVKRENPPQDTESQVNLPTQTTYIHKLFDRSVDFAKFSKDTSLYALARAWMKNKPYDVEKDSLPQTPSTSESGQNSDDVISLPPPLGESLSCSRIPDSDQQTRVEPWDTNDLKADGPGISELLDQHLTRWKQVRKRWKDASHNNQRRYMSSIQIIRKVFNQHL